MFKDIYKNKKILITGHTGFKGSWLSLWLSKLGAEILGYSNGVPTKPSHFKLLNLDLASVKGDIRDLEKFRHTVKDYKPEIIFHLAAQPLVQCSYKYPLETFETNIMGTVNLFESIKDIKSVIGIVNVTSDKCYKDLKWHWGYRENDSLGGSDPYSASKSCSEIITNCYRNSFYNLSDYGKTHNVLISTARAGNVIGGGDWAQDRLIPDVIRSMYKGRKMIIRNPYSVRPWQHVLESLSGYLMIGQRLLEGKKQFAEEWNFSPNNEQNYNVESILNIMKKYWDKFDYDINKNLEYKDEVNILRVDSSKAFYKLNWRPVWDIKIAIKNTISWYKEFYENKNILSEEQLKKYILNANENKSEWIN